MDNLFDEMRVFARVAELGSFSKSARELRLSQSSVSRLIADLERRLGTRLVLRSTHEVAVTESGRAFLDHVHSILEAVREATEAAQGAESLNGLLRVAAPATFGTRTVVPILARFLQDHPGLRVDLIPLDETQQLLTQAIDVAIRFGRLPDSDFGARRLASLPRVAVASPGYLAERGTPETPAALAGHDCLFGPGLTARASWLFEGEDTPPGRIIERVGVATAEGVVACAVAGLGIAVATQVLCREDVAAGRLVEILSAYPLQYVDLHAVFPAGRKPSVKVRAFVDHLADALVQQGLRST